MAACYFFRAFVIRSQERVGRKHVRGQPAGARRVGGRFYQLRTRVVVERRIVDMPADRAVAHQTFYEGVAVVDQQRNPEGSTGRTRGRSRS